MLEEKAGLNLRIPALMKFLISITIVLFILSVGFNIYYYTFHDLRYVSNLFNVDKEDNIPTWFSSMNLLFAAILFFLISRIKKKSDEKYVLNWFFLGVIFFIMALDEFAQLHEQTSQLFQGYIKGLHFAWLIPGIIFSIVVASIYLKFFLDFEPRWKKLFFFSALIYLMGVIGMEIIGNIFQADFGQDNLGYIFVTTIEEGFEFSGQMLLIYSLLSYLQYLSPCYRIDIKN